MGWRQDLYCWPIRKGWFTHPLLFLLLVRGGTLLLRIRHGGRQVKINEAGRLWASAGHCLTCNITSHLIGIVRHVSSSASTIINFLCHQLFATTLCCPKNRFRSLRTEKSSSAFFFIRLWGKSPEKQSISLTIPRKAAGFKHVGTG